MIQQLKEFFMKCVRVWAVMKKPTKEEIKATATAAGLGILLLGLIGFVISAIVKLSGVFK